MLVSRYSSQSSVIFVANEGRGGEQVEFALARFNAAFEADRPDVVLLMEGYNDICCGNGEVGVNKTDLGVNTIAAEARNRGARVFVATLAPSKPGFRATPMEVIQAANDRIRIIARGEGAYLVDIYAALLPNVDANIGIDGLHPTEVGYRRMAEAFFAAIQADLEIH
jgi:lysophospholipase L1-like esterase